MTHSLSEYLTVETAELNSIDLRLEHARCRNTHTERSLLAWIIQEGVQDPLLVTVSEAEGRFVLLDGFKRYRCARKVGTGIVPIEVIGESVADGVVALLRRNRSPGLSTLEQAVLVECLHTRHGMGIQEIANRVGYSSSWVCLRLHFLEGMSDLVRSRIMAGTFPARAYMYGIKTITRVKSTPSAEIDAFVDALSGTGLSTRELFVLAQGYFGGNGAIKELVTKGTPRRALQLLSVQEERPGDGYAAFTAPQRAMLSGLKLVATNMQRVQRGLPDVTWAESGFAESVNFWTDNIRTHWESFAETVRELHDRSRPSPCGQDIA